MVLDSSTLMDNGTTSRNSSCIDLYKTVLTVTRWAPITDADATACGLPQEFDASKKWAGKKVVLVSVPGKSHHLLSLKIDG